MTSGTVDEWLERAVCWRFAATLFRPPNGESVTGLRALVPMLPPALRESAHGLTEVDPDAWEREFHRVLGPGGLPSCESSFDRAALAARGPLLAAIAGFYQAFAYRVAPGDGDAPDDIAVELDFLGYLAFKAAYARHERLNEELEITASAYADFLRDHLGFWMAPFLEAVLATDSDFYGAAAAWTQGMLETASG